MKATEEDGFSRDIPTGYPLHAMPLLRTKLRIPPVHPLSIPRPHLMARLHRSKEFKLTLVSAPTGFGKTTLLSEWATQCAHPVLWISLNESDNDPAHFWTYMIDALVSLAGQTDEKAQALLSFTSVESILAAVTGIAAAISQEFMLILDDYHTIQNPQIHSAFTLLLEYLPAHMHICLASRTRPPLPLARLRAYRQLYELRPEALLFTLEEIEMFLTRTLGQELSPGQAVAIKTRTEGWVAIIYLVAIWLQEQKEGWQALERMPGDQRYILEYLTEEVLQQQPQAVQEFLLKTSILAQFNSNLCNAVTGQSDAQVLLEQIERANLFLVPLDQQQSWYGYHQLFRAYLRARLEQVFSDLVPLLHKRARAWYEQQGMTAEAVTHALAVGDFEHTTESILKVGEKMLMRGEIDTLLSWLKALPEEFVRLSPPLCLFYAWSLMMVGQFDAAEMWLGNLDDIDKEKDCMPELPRQDLTSWDIIPYVPSIIAVLRAHIAIFWGEISRVANFTLQAQETLPQENVFVLSLNMLNLGVAKWLGRDVSGAEAAFTAAATSGRHLDNNYVMLAADCGLVMTQMMQGKRRRAFAIAQQALQLAAKHKNYLSPFSMYLYTETSQLFYEWNKLEEAAHYAHEALAYGDKENMDIQMYSYALLSRIELARGNLDEAQKFIVRAEEGLLYSQHRPWISARLAEQLVELALVRKDLHKAEYWSQLPELQQFGSLAVILPMRVLLAKNQPREALRLAQVYLQDSEQHGRLLPMILQARAYQDLDEASEAARILDEALRLAEPEGYIRFFLNEGPQMARMLHSQLKRYEEQHIAGAHATAGDSSVRGKLSRYVYLLLDEFAKERPQKLVSSPLLDGQSDQLSRRELDILRSMTIGLSNEEIAQRMVIAENTVRWHIKNIYSKLQVHNRAQAILKAQSLRLF